MYNILKVVIFIFLIMSCVLSSTTRFSWFNFYNYTHLITSTDFFLIFYFFFINYIFVLITLIVILGLFSIFFIFYFFYLKSNVNSNSSKKKEITFIRKQSIIKQSNFNIFLRFFK